MEPPPLTGSVSATCNRPLSVKATRLRSIRGARCEDSKLFCVKGKHNACPAERAVGNSRHPRALLGHPGRAGENPDGLGRSRQQLGLYSAAEKGPGAAPREVLRA